MNIRRVILRSTVVSVATLALMSGSPAFARIRDDGADPGPGLSPLETFLIFVVAPVGAFVLISLLVMAPSIARGPRYRTNRRWAAQPQIFGARQDISAVETDEPAEEGGGSSARW